MKIALGICIFIIVLFLFSSSSSQKSIETTYSENNMQEITDCANDYKSSLKEYAQIIHEVQLLTQAYQTDYEGMYELLSEIANAVDIGDPYSPIYDCF